MRFTAMGSVGIGDAGLRAAVLVCALVMALMWSPPPAHAQQPKVFATPEEGVQALTDAAKAADVNALLAIFGADGSDLLSSSDAATLRRNREVFAVAMAEGWRLLDQDADRKELIVGREAWPFPVPLVKTAGGWKFDTAAGKEEVLARRIGRNELAVIRISRTYVAAQQLYARRAHDDKPAGLYARQFTADPGTQNGLYWPEKRGEPRSPLGPLVAEAAAEGRKLGTNDQPAPFHGYYFRILDAQGAAAPGGAKSYVVNGTMSGGFALITWPAQYDATGVMTFIVNQDGVVHQKDLGPDTTALAATIMRYDPDQTWQPVPADEPQ